MFGGLQYSVDGCLQLFSQVWVYDCLLSKLLPWENKVVEMLFVSVFTVDAVA